MIITGDG